MMTTYLNGPGTGLMVGGAPLLTGKFVPPTTSAVLVERPRLLRLLTAAAAEPLTLVCGPAGPGQTAPARRGGGAFDPRLWTGGLGQDRPRRQLGSQHRATGRGGVDLARRRRRRP